MEDVAAAAGVDKATVSRALKGDPRISSSTREKVWIAARELGYGVDFAARGLSGGRTSLAAVVLEDTFPWFSPALFEGMNRVLSREGMDILLKMPGSSPGKTAKTLASHRVECVAWLGKGGPEFQQVLPNIPVPMVTAGFSVHPFPAVLLSEQGTMDRIASISGGCPLRLLTFEKMLFPFLSRHIEPFHPLPEGAFFTVADGLPGTTGAMAGRGCAACMPGQVPPVGWHCLEWPAFEMGVTMARIMLNALRGQGPCPQETLLVPVLRNPAGEPLPHVKEKNQPKFI